MYAEKKRLIAIRHEHPFDIFGLAQRARVAPDIVYRMLLDEPVPREYAIRVLEQLSREIGLLQALLQAESANVQFFQALPSSLVQFRLLPESVERAVGGQGC